MKIPWLHIAAAVAGYSLVNWAMANQVSRKKMFQNKKSRQKSSEPLIHRVPSPDELHTIPDAFGNYDIDGVSFDTDGVIVSGDDNKFHGQPSVEKPLTH